MDREKNRLQSRSDARVFAGSQVRLPASIVRSSLAQSGYKSGVATALLA
jgi:hypothetical protein